MTTGSADRAASLTRCTSLRRRRGTGRCLAPAAGRPHRRPLAGTVRRPRPDPRPHRPGRAGLRELHERVRVPGGFVLPHDRATNAVSPTRPGKPTSPSSRSGYCGSPQAGFCCGIPPEPPRPRLRPPPTTAPPSAARTRPGRPGRRRDRRRPPGRPLSASYPTARLDSTADPGNTPRRSRSWCAWRHAGDSPRCAVVTAA